MNEQVANLHVTPDLRAWSKILAAYRKPNNARGVLEILITVLPLVLLWVLMWASLDIGYWLCLLLSVPAAGFLVRLFVIQHDCGHGAFFRQRVVNDWVGRVVSVLTLTPYDWWRRTHAIHHAHSGNLDHRGIGDIDMLTVREYLALSRSRRLLYRLYRHPLVMFGIGPVYNFVLRQRLPVGLMRSGWQPWASTMATNVAIAIFVALLIWLVGVGPFLLVHLPITFLGAAIGVWLFYVQHQFENTYWQGQDGWDFHEASVMASSFYDLPQPLRWFSGNIGIHHIHHLSSRIPNYRLGDCLADIPALQTLNRIGLRGSLSCLRLALWDENARRLISFKSLRRTQFAAA